MFQNLTKDTLADNHNGTMSIKSITAEHNIDIVAKHEEEFLARPAWPTRRRYPAGAFAGKLLFIIYSIWFAGWILSTLCTSRLSRISSFP